MVPHLLSLPDEVLRILYGFVNDEHLISGLSQTCRRLHLLSKATSLWTHICEPIYQLMGMKREYCEYISDQRGFYYDQMRTRRKIYALLDELEFGTSESPEPSDESYNVYIYSTIRNICGYKETAIPYLYAIYTSDPVELPLGLTRQFYAKSILAVIVKLRAIEVLKSRRFSGDDLFEFILAVRDLCSDSLNYELLQFLDNSTLDNLLETVRAIPDAPAAENSTRTPMVAEELIQLMRDGHYFETLRTDIEGLLGPRFALAGTAALYTHFARRLGLNACTLVLESWSCVLITVEWGDHFIVDVEQYWVRSAKEVPEVSGITRRKLNDAIKNADERIAGVLLHDIGLASPGHHVPRTALALYVLCDLFRGLRAVPLINAADTKAMSSLGLEGALEAIIQIPLHVLVLEKMPGNPSFEVKDILHKTLNAPGETVKSRKFLTKVVKFKVGQICTLTIGKPKLGVIVGWDQQHRDYARIPDVFYKWLSENRESYEPQSKLEEVSPTPDFKSLCTPDGVADYTKLGEYFLRFDEQSIQPNRYLRYIYPDD